MPKFDIDDSLEEHKVGNFGFTAVSTDDLEAAGYTLATIACDKSGSTRGFQGPMEAALSASVAALKRHPNSESIMLRVLTMDSVCDEIHGFIPLSDIDPARYDGILAPGGGTPLFDACVNGAEATTKYGLQLRKDRFSANGILIVITDGENNDGKFSREADVGYVKKAFEEGLSKEALESFTTILIAVNMQDSRVARILTAFHKDAGFTIPLIELKDASEKTIAKVGQFITDSVSSTSTSLGSGGPSTAITF